MRTNTASQNLLRRALVADAAITGLTGMLMVGAAVPLAQLLGLPTTLLRLAGLSLLPFAVLLAYLSRRPHIPRTAVWAVVGYNLLWAIDSLVLLFTSWVEPTMLGYVFVAGQALVVASFAELQYFGMRQA